MTRFADLRGSKSTVPTVSIHVTDSAGVLLAALAAHDRTTISALVTELACARARAIGLSHLARAVAERSERSS